MASEMGDSTNREPQSPSCSGNGENDAGDFECNICFELAHDPVVTLCGHLYCWPCLYKWLRVHSNFQECPVCKALIQKEKLIPLYGRGKTPTDPRSKPVPGVEIPNRPAGQRPETANNFANVGLGFGFVPMTTSRIGNIAISGGFGGLFPPLFGIQLHGSQGTAVYGASSGIRYGLSGGFHGAHAHDIPQRPSEAQQAYLKHFFNLLGFLVLLFLMCSY
ncbi:E3 ubiquitin-protein like [Actinidia chinensis var. chinensis]|uniref:E3 ubiquitin-protein ligase RMA n=1 Tax=Actinidia chinensis var. chinensis TaxID=1590841 RepID=A0A2R6RL99_ACTCC|nr:E3 ubiquitin-protein like [Actinidia chinensis var. chinensis]